VKLILLDRDGVINFDSEEFIRSEEQWRAIPGSLQAIGRLCRAGWRVVIVSNQSGLALGKFTVENLNAIHQKMIAHLSQYGGVIDAIFFCPHGPDDGCDCRKPKPGLLKRAAAELGCTLRQVPLIGDKESEVAAALAVGARPIAVGARPGQRLPAGVEHYADLAAAAAVLISERQHQR
jgi:D-glycero-D-manno-heptose 1,7-bisphosphate phosphatase